MAVAKGKGVMLLVASIVAALTATGLLTFIPYGCGGPVPPNFCGGRAALAPPGRAPGQQSIGDR